MPVTPNYGLPYPAGTDAPDLPLIIGNIATAMDEAMQDFEMAVLMGAVNNG